MGRNVGRDFGTGFGSQLMRGVRVGVVTYLLINLTNTLMIW